MRKKNFTVLLATLFALQPNIAFGQEIGLTVFEGPQMPVVMLQAEMDTDADSNLTAANESESIKVAIQTEVNALPGDLNARTASFKLKMEVVSELNDWLYGDKFGDEQIEGGTGNKFKYVYHDMYNSYKKLYFSPDMNALLTRIKGVYANIDEAETVLDPAERARIFDIYAARLQARMTSVLHVMEGKQQDLEEEQTRANFVPPSQWAVYDALSRLGITQININIDGDTVPLTEGNAYTALRTESTSKMHRLIMAHPDRAGGNTAAFQELSKFFNTIKEWKRHIDLIDII